MFPILYSFGPVRIFTYGFFLALAFIAALYVAGREAKRLGDSPEQIYDLGFYIVLAAIIGSRLLHVVLEWRYFASQPLDIFMLWKGGLAFQGGLILGVPVATFYIYRHRMPFWRTLDTLAVGTPLGQCIGRMGCFMAGCCYGKACSLPWGVTFNDPNTLARPQGVPLHPTQLYESLLTLGIFMVMLRLRHRQKFPGQLVGVYLLLAGAARFVVEFWRGDDRGPVLLWGMPSTQVIALGLMLAAVLFLGWRSRAVKVTAT
ncbi:prolipoprotein diacylglyceryl transferase [Desulfobacca acetoxidans]|uniref:Phosphatidylglycerol--prolipoprotein diacylglyceryl transferase n=1 Tax=Desulfobacca acetoxidans (strain ATCC 700848 / DSM 11109 / ASRB2) TaxID=880072 RepID=F2NE80_DESAR|nr:prolipoprotein diacylglyceryl transferase [Desulfobacca acetoxidans]AEB10710.1 Prolipoprotein diacylglyceryl transferase [Desulfobacca acetoxidans DSM 11109]